MWRRWGRSAHHHQLHAAVQATTLGAAVVGQRGGFSVADGGDAVQRHARQRQVLAHGVGALLAQLGDAHVAHS